MDFNVFGSWGFQRTPGDSQRGIKTIQLFKISELNHKDYLNQMNEEKHAVFLCHFHRVVHDFLAKRSNCGYPT
jgi:hypothetical protein